MKTPTASGQRWEAHQVMFRRLGNRLATAALGQRSRRAAARRRRDRHAVVLATRCERGPLCITGEVDDQFSIPSRAPRPSRCSRAGPARCCPTRAASSSWTGSPPAAPGEIREAGFNTQSVSVLPVGRRDGRAGLCDLSPHRRQRVLVRTGGDHGRPRPLPTTNAAARASTSRIPEAPKTPPAPPRPDGAHTAYRRFDRVQGDLAAQRVRVHAGEL